MDFTGTGTDQDKNTPLTFLWQFGGSVIANSTVEGPGAETVQYRRYLYGKLYGDRCSGAYRYYSCHPESLPCRVPISRQTG